ncbi:uncharacterized protein LOC128246789 [Mya arenaria]|nr:uncharacterized protein LOC128246789 [Mya arenaria]
MEKVHATVNHAGANQIPDLTNKVLEIKELLFSRFSSKELKRMWAPDESSVTMKMQNLSVNEEEDLSISLVYLLTKEINLLERGDDPLQKFLSRAVQRALTKFKQYGTLTKVLRGSVVFFIQLSFVNCYDDMLSGRLTT